MNTIKVLKEFNQWRRGADIPQPDPKIIGIALDNILDEVIAWRKPLVKTRKKRSIKKKI